MGNQIKSNQTDLSNTHPQFKTAKLIKEKDHEYIKSTTPCDEQVYNQWKTILQRDQKQLSNSHFLLLPTKHTFTRQNLCSHNGSVQIEYESYPYLLSEQILRRKDNQSKFLEGDLWFLLYALTRARFEVNQISGYLGDVRPENVFLNQKGEIKIASLYSFPHSHHNLNKFLEKQPTYLAPQDLQLLRKGVTSNETNKKAQMFAIGLTVIQAGILENPSSIYDTSNMSLKNDAFKFYLQKWRHSHQYSQIFRAIILNLVQLNPNDRLSVEDLWKWIVKYEGSIRAKEKFVIKTEHPIIEKQVKVIRNLEGFVQHGRLQQTMPK